MGFRIHRGLRRAALLAIVCLFVPALASGDSRAVRGIVTDQNGNPLKGAIVQIKDTRSLSIRSYIAQKDGSYQFQGLALNVDYALQAHYDGEESSVKTLSMFDSRPIAFIDLRVDLKKQ